MDDKERFDAFMVLAEFRRTIREARRSIEWRVTLGVWAALAATSISGPSTVPAYMVGEFLIVVFVFHVIWVGWHFRIHEKERIEMYYYKDRAERLLVRDEIGATTRAQLTRPPGILQLFFSFPALAEILITLFLSVVAFATIYYRSKS
jgi:hypothetical protein